jgi:hypothetical protein
VGGIGVQMVYQWRVPVVSAGHFPRVDQTGPDPCGFGLGGAGQFLGRPAVAATLAFVLNGVAIDESEIPDVPTLAV